MKVSLVLPVYNEEANIQKGVLDKIGNYTQERDIFSEVIIVDDGSMDSTREMIKEKYLKKYHKFKLIENNHQGKAYALLTGIKHAQGDCVMFCDIDLATPIEESGKLISALVDGYKIVIGSRSSSRQGAPFLRKLMAVGFIYIRDMMIGLNGIKDTQCGFKLFEKKAAETIIDKLQVFKKGKPIAGSSVSAGFDLEFLFVANQLKYKIREVHVSWRHVETKNVNFFKDSIETLTDIIRIRYNDVKGNYSS